MSNFGIGLSLFGAMLALMVLRAPISVAMFLPGAAGYWLIAGDGALLNYLKGSVFARFSSYDLSVIPLFILMGQFATQGGLSRSLFRFASSLLGHLRGGVAMAAILACALFGAVCGSSVATAATLAQVALPEMRRLNYSGRLSTATLAVGGTLGILIPPSVPLVVYAILTETNIAKLFMAAFLPGAIAVIGYCVVIGITVKLKPALGPALPKASNRERLRALVEIWPIAAVFALVFGGIYGGIFTPTEGAAVGAAGTFVAALLRRELGLRGIGRAFLGTAVTSGMIFLVFLGADMLNGALALSQMPKELADWVTRLGWSPLAVIAVIIAMYVVMGFFMDELATIILTIPVIFPAIMGLDLWGLGHAEKAIWFGILMLMVVEIGLVHPPVGLNIYVINSLAKDVPMMETFKGVLPFLASDFLRVALLFIFPAISLYLVRLIF
ncbi:MAG TPA: TRAP transporter large permease [Burkholderiales bacterium]|nr:TRAP transporter large permease [Burkholderiales bacterium]